MPPLLSLNIRCRSSSDRHRSRSQQAFELYAFSKQAKIRFDRYLEAHCVCPESVIRTALATVHIVLSSLRQLIRWLNIRFTLLIFTGTAQPGASLKSVANLAGWMKVPYPTTVIRGRPIRFVAHILSSVCNLGYSDDAQIIIAIYRNWSNGDNECIAEVLAKMQLKPACHRPRTPIQ